MTLTPDEAVAHLRRRHHIREQGSHNCAECNDPWTPGVGCPTVIVLDAYAGTDNLEREKQAAEADLADEQAHADRLAERLRSFAERSTYPEDAAAALRDHDARRQG